MHELAIHSDPDILDYQNILAPHRIELSRYQKHIDKVIARITDAFRERKVQATVELGGSVAKGTFLKGFDVDIFVRFKKKVNTVVLGDILKKLFSRVSTVHGSRDYFQFVHKGLHYEIVPVHFITKPSDAENSTDVSPFHVAWVQKYLQEPDHVRLAKLFAKANGLYGAESYLNGFSGYVLEILISRYGSFQTMIRAMAQWKPKVVLDPAHHYKSTSDLLKMLNSSKQESPLILIDPVQKERNAAAALSLETFSRCVDLARGFIEAPEVCYFQKQRFSLREIKRRAKTYDLVLSVARIKLLESKSDIALTKAVGAFAYLRRQIEMHGFTLVDAGYEMDEHLFWFLTLPHRLSRYEKRVGPLVWENEEQVRGFHQKHPLVFVQHDRLVTLVPRPYRTVRALLKDLFRRDEVTSRLRRIKLKWF